MNRDLIRRYRRRWPVFVWLILVWVALWGTPSLANILGGAAVAIAVGLVFPLPPLPTVLRLRPLKLLSVAGHFAFDLVVASFQVAWLAWRPGPPPGVAVIRVEVATSSEATMTLVAELTSLVPGSIVLETDAVNRSLYLHVLGTDTEQDLTELRERVQIMDRRVRKAFGAHTTTKEASAP